MTAEQTTHAVAAIAEALAGTGGTLAPEIVQELDAIDVLDWTKADPIVDLVQRFDAEEARHQAAADAILAQAAPHTSRAKAAAKAAEQLREYLRTRMLALKVDRLEGPLHLARLQRNGQPTFKLADPKAVPPELQKVTITLDTDKARVAYKAGTLPDGVKADLGWQLRIDR